MTTKQLQKILLKEKINNVDIVDDKIVFDNISKTNYNTVLRQLKKVENDYDVDLSFYIDYLNGVKKELLNEIKNANKFLGTVYEREKLDVLKDVSSKLKNALNSAKEFIPNRYSKGFKHKPLKYLHYTQYNIGDLSDTIEYLYADKSGADINLVKRLLNANVPEEQSYYDRLMYLQGALPDNRDSILDKYTYLDDNKQDVIYINGNETKALSREDALKQIQKEMEENDGIIGFDELDAKLKRDLSNKEYKELKEREEFLTNIQFIKMGW